jgi:hypothetical protein
MNSSKKTIAQIITECFIAVLVGVILGSTVRNTLSLVQKDLLIVSVVLFTFLLLTTWQGIRYLSFEWRITLFKILAGNDILVANAIMGPKYGLLVTSGRDLIVTNSVFHNSKNYIAALYVEGNSEAYISNTSFLGEVDEQESSDKA